MTYRTDLMAMAQEANLGRLLPAVGKLPAQWYGSDIKALEKFEAFVITKERERAREEAAQTKQGVKS